MISNIVKLSLSVRFKEDSYPSLGIRLQCVLAAGYSPYLKCAHYRAGILVNSSYICLEVNLPLKSNCVKLWCFLTQTLAGCLHNWPLADLVGS